ncbi:exodeoxyribonuclease VII small subunit [candidate division KSB3 bacterium]|uniref:Exodeoxyribonuclease 7 small subunit n=1 Tax=candidate division KSB3 bacterium TaxID=2044937 RepID=A0A9D5Q8E4_9BACT|nr:exodeoxyribonuclease VII small subunit [candidate division KSB3 bacterium]MBD3327388.1 exodeoxyribonuclease VII small subunit [candidate division KSB3 bacterium]
MKEITFEKALQTLEESVQQLETGNLPLEKALEVFERGVTMSRICAKKLDEAEQKVELLLNVTDEGEPQTTLFDMQHLQDATGKEE